MRRPWALVTAGLALAGAAYVRFARGRASRTEPVPDPRAEELRRKLAEAQAIVAEREEFEGAETPVDEAKPAPTHVPATPAREGEVDDRRREVHARAREAIDHIGSPPKSGDAS